ncbi:MAG TPA: alpha-amylase family glycosyl hydrolase [Polyangiaceae bacterium]|nr:alpha-amylase family glycosyl hydrolase [Polyangiaceae bacterium]
MAPVDRVPPRPAHLWWQKGIVYQVYPRSFADSDGNGVGDLPGVLSKLDYLEWLGVDAIWLSPVFPSPMADFGYDVSDYTGIHPIFGNLHDMQELIERTHQRGMKLILDFVPNHTSDQHPWFLEARSSRSNPKRDWYLWKDAKPGGGAPNNWLSVFGGSGWTWDAATEQYYYHAFLEQQPDLNWRHPELRRAMYAAMRFWLDRGVDGFRVDVLWHLIKDSEWRDNPPNPDYRPNQVPYNTLLPAYSTDQPEVQEIACEMRSLLDEYPERVLIGEIYLPIRRLVAYYGTASNGAHLPFNFQLITLPWDAKQIAAVISEYEGALPTDAWPNWVLGNHDQPRVASRLGLAQARVAAVLLLTLRGTPTLYYGDELGMRDAVIFPEQMQDPQGKNIGVSRDPARTPMQWTADKFAGFSAVEPWLPLGFDHQYCNVEAQRQDPDSMLALYHRLIALRRAEPALNVGTYKPVPTDGALLAYVRECGEQRFLMALNLGSRPAHLLLADIGPGQVVLATDARREGERLSLRLVMLGDDAVVIRLD